MAHSMIQVCGREIKIRGTLLKVASLHGDTYKFMENPEAVIEELRNVRRRIDLFTFMQRLPDTEPKYSYPMEWDNLAVMPVSTFEHWWNHQIRSYPRNRARQAEKRGVILREAPFDESLARGIWEIYNECPVRQGRRFSHYGKDYATVYKEESTHLDASIFIGAFFEDKLIGIAKLVADESGTQANLMNIVSMVRYKDKAPTNALIAQAVRSCADRKIPYLAYSKFSYGTKTHDTLMHFKEINGFSQVNFPRYYIPFSYLGRLALKFGLHHGLAEGLPEPVVAKVRQVRAAWNSRKLQRASKDLPASEGLLSERDDG